LLTIAREINLPIPLSLNGVTYQYPRLGDENWGQDATNWAVGITQLVNSIDTLINNTIASGIYELANGSAATPSLRFQSSLTTGIYRSAADTLGFTSAGVQSGQISSTGQLQWISGTAAAPSFTFINDPDTGIYNGTPNQLSFTTNGAAAGNIDSTGLWTLNALSVTGTATLPTANVTTLNVTTANVDQINANGYILDEQTTVTLLNFSTGNVFTFPVASNKNFIVDYSLVRATGKETGQLIISSDGTTVQVAGNASTVVDCGVSFEGDVNSGNVRLRYSTTNTGTDVTMRYVVKRWND
jgi:hypothetical protein